MFFDKSTRTRNSFEAGMTQLGGHAHFLTADVMQVSHGESPKDTGIILSSYGHGIAIRHDLIPGEGNAYMREVAQVGRRAGDQHAMRRGPSLPDPGGPDDHPREARARTCAACKMAVTWAYAPSYAKPLSVPQGLIMLMPRFGMDVVLAHPPEYGLMPETHAGGSRQRAARRRQVRGGGQHGRGLPRRRHGDPQELGLPGHHGQQTRGIAAHRQAVYAAGSATPTA